MNHAEWETYINELQAQSTVNITETQPAVALMMESIQASMARALTIVPRTPNTIKLGVLFSGGVDSTLLCFLLQQANIKFVAITIGFQDLKNPHFITKGFSRCQKFKCKGWSVKHQPLPKRIFSHNERQKLPDDILVARQVAEKYNFNHIEKMYNYEEVAKLFKETVSILGPKLTNTVNVGVGSVELAGLKTLKEAHPEISYVMGGIGSEEIFAGYHRHQQSDNVTKECWNGLRGMFVRDLLRDKAIGLAYNITWLTPLLDKQLILDAMRIDDSLKIIDGVSKHVLRLAAINLGLAEEFAWRPKKAAQYGSRTDSAIDKLAKKNGFEFKKDYLASLLPK